MPLISLHKVEKGFAGVPCLADLTCALEPGEKVGLVGPNGSGKTTLLRVLAGELEVESGTVAIARGARLGYLPQRPEPPPGKTVREWVVESAREDDPAHALETPEERERRAVEMLTRLGFRREQLDVEAARLSGGEKSRAGLARVLRLDPDVLLLDEPTNHLDLSALEWLEDRLARWRRAAIVVSHDRYFLDRVVTRIFALEHGAVEAYRGDYTRYARLREERRARADKEQAQHEAFVEKQREFIRRFGAGQRSKEAKGREKRLERYIAEKEAGGPAGPPRDRTFSFGFEAGRRSGDEVLAARRLGHVYPPADGAPARPLFGDLDLDIRRGERVGVIGPNGSGKTTFFRIVVGEMAPQAGEARRGAALDVGYYRQEGEDLDPEKSILSLVHDAAPREDLVTIRSVCGRFGFRDDEQEKRIGTLSGGERARVSLAKLFLKRPNFLVLDEPTNHLDLPAREALEEALDDYDGTILAISHDRYFLDRIVEKVVAFGAGPTPRTLIGNYTECRPKLRELYAPAEPAGPKAAAGPAAAAAATTATAGAGAPAAPPRPQRVKKKHTFEQLEAKILAAEARVKELEAAMAAPENARDHVKLKQVAADFERTKAELPELYAEWEVWAEELSG